MSASSKSASGYHHGDLKRALIEAATAIVAEDQNWEFSLREVARRAGVSHNAPYRHFPEKLDLLAAVAADGFGGLRDAMARAAQTGASADGALVAIGAAYVRFGLANPARYRLMFGTALGPSRAGLPPLVGEAAAGSKAVLADVIAEGVHANVLVPPVPGDAGLGLLTLSAWSTVHGLTMLLIDGLAEVEPTPTSLPETIGSLLVRGLAAR